jgi:hypothetical protein
MQGDIYITKNNITLATGFFKGKQLFLKKTSLGKR